MPLANYFANWLFAVSGWLLVGVKSTDLHSGMRAYSHRVIHEVEFDPNGPALPVELLLKPALEGFRAARSLYPVWRAHRRNHAAALVLHRLDLPPYSSAGALPLLSGPQTKLTKSTTLAD